MSFLCHTLGIHKFRDEQTRELLQWDRTVYSRYQRCQRCHKVTRERYSAKPPRRLRPYRKDKKNEQD